jgi:hypothetical protein
MKGLRVINTSKYLLYIGQTVISLVNNILIRNNVTSHLGEFFDGNVM